MTAALTGGNGSAEAADRDRADAVTVSLVGSTGSIGTQALEVVEASGDRFRVVALGAFRSVEALAAQARRT